MNATKSEMKPVILRPYQWEEAIQPLMRRFASGYKQAALCFPTGSGKTHTADYVAKRLTIGKLAPFDVAWFTAPLSSVADKLVKGGQKYMTAPQVPYDPDVCPKTNGWSKTTLKARDYTPCLLNGPLHVSTSAYLVEWHKAQDVYPDLSRCLLILDEGHHSGDSDEGNKTSQVRDRWIAAGGSVLYLTATPYRTDGIPIFDVDEVSPIYRSMARHAQEGHAPANWEYVSEEMTGCYGKGTAEDIRSGAEHIASYWHKHGRRKLIIKVQHSGQVDGSDTISQTWANALYLAFQKYLPRELDSNGQLKPDRILKVVGEETKQEFLARMRQEDVAERYMDSTCDVIISCMRFKEATDWKFCSSVYRIGPPSRSIGEMIQFLGRAQRFKGGIEGYPSEYADVATLTEFHYDLFGRSPENERERQRRVVLLTAMQEQAHYGKNTKDLRYELRSSLGKGRVRDSLMQVFEQVSVTGMSAELLEELHNIPKVQSLLTNRDATLKDVYLALKRAKKADGSDLLDTPHKVRLLEMVCAQAEKAQPDQAAVVRDYIHRAKQGFQRISRTNTGEDCTKILEDHLLDLLDALVQQVGDKLVWTSATQFNSEARMNSKDARDYAAFLTQEKLLAEVASTDEKVCQYIEDSLRASGRSFLPEKAEPPFKAHGHTVSWGNLENYVKKRARYSLVLRILHKLSPLILKHQEYTRVEILTALRAAREAKSPMPSDSIPLESVGQGVKPLAKYDATKAFGREANWGCLALALDRGWWGFPSGLTLEDVSSPPWATGWVAQSKPPSKEEVLKAVTDRFGKTRPTTDENLSDASAWFPQYGVGTVVWKDVFPIIGW